MYALKILWQVFVRPLYFGGQGTTEQNDGCRLFAGRIVQKVVIPDAVLGIEGKVLHLSSHADRLHLFQPAWLMR